MSKQIVDGTHFTPNYIDTGIPFLRVTDIHTSEIDLGTVRCISEKEHIGLNKRCNPERGDVLLSKNGTIGITRVVDWDYPFSIFVSLCLIKPRHKLLDPYFFSYFFKSSIVDEQIFMSSKQTSVTNLHLDKIRELIVIVPPLPEQQAITKHLDLKTAEINAAIERTQREIELIEEYRTTLIAHAVTGKIDVRKENSG
jgi:type I restriction enzyme S subunit